MVKLRKSAERGYNELSWLTSWYTFSFAEYSDPHHIRHRTLRVINQDIIAPGGGFPMHSHQDMEILTFVISGQLEHKDSLGNSSVIGPGEIQRMSAGRGVTHSEFNPSATQETELLQIWIFPKEKGLEPSYEQQAYSQLPAKDHMRLLASPVPGAGAVTIHQEAKLYLGQLMPGEQVSITTESDTYGWLQLVRGEITANDMQLSPGDGLASSERVDLRITGKSDAQAEFLWFELD